MANPFFWWNKFLALPNVHPVKTIGMALLVALVASMIVSYTAVTLRPLQEANRLKESAASMMDLLDSLGVEAPKSRLVDLSSGVYVERDPGTQSLLPPERDAAGLGEREDVAAVYELYRDGALALVILPVRGSGYQSMLKGYLALESDLNTVAALIFYEQNETPGMGANLMEDAWISLWSGKMVAGADGVIRLQVVKGAGEGVFEVDGISGATRTSSGVTDLLRFWLGSDGYGPYLARLRAEEAS